MIATEEGIPAKDDVLRIDPVLTFTLSIIASDISETKI